MGVKLNKQMKIQVTKVINEQGLQKTYGNDYVAVPKVRDKNGDILKLPAEQFNKLVDVAKGIKEKQLKNT